MTKQPLRILLIGINYAPEHSGIAPYTTDAAQHLAAEGHEIRVLTGVDHYPHWRPPRKMRWHLRLHEKRRGVYVTRLRHYVPRRQSALRRSLYEITFGAHVAVAANWRPDVVVAVVPSLLGTAAASWYAKRWGVPFVVWVQDLMGKAAAQSGISGGRALARLTAALERSVLRSADRVLVVSDAFRSHVRAAGVPDALIVTLPNWSHVPSPAASRDETRRRLGWDDGRLVAVHTGNMGLKQDLANVVAAGELAARQRLPVRFVLVGDGSQRGRLAALASAVPTVDVLPPVDDDGYIDLLAAADVLLVNERASLLDMSLPSKLTSYFVAGRPVVAATHTSSGTAREVLRAGAGRVVEPANPQALLEAVRLLGEDPQRSSDAGKRAQLFAQANLTREAGVRTFADMVTGVCARDR